MVFTAKKKKNISNWGKENVMPLHALISLSPRMSLKPFCFQVPQLIWFKKILHTHIIRIFRNNKTTSTELKKFLEKTTNTVAQWRFFRLRFDILASDRIHFGLVERINQSEVTVKHENCVKKRYPEFKKMQRYKKLMKQN